MGTQFCMGWPIHWCQRGNEKAAGKLDGYPVMKILELKEFVLLTFSAEEKLEDKRNRNVSNLIINIALEAKGRQEYDKGIGRYTSTEALLV